MPYIGRGTDKLSNVEVLDNITFDGSSSYTLQKGGSNFTPSSANNILISIDGVVQAGNFTVSSSTIDFGTAVAGTSTCDFILHYGTGLITTPADGTVTTAKLADSSVSLAKLTATGTKDATTFLRGDNTFGVPPLGGITEADQWRLTSSTTVGTTDTIISANLERVDSTGFGYIGTGMTESSGEFTFPSTGIYKISFTCLYGDSGTAIDWGLMYLDVTTDNFSSSSNVAYVFSHLPASSGRNQGTAEYFFDVTNTSTHKVRFRVLASSANAVLLANTSYNRTTFTFTRLGDT